MNDFMKKLMDQIKSVWSKWKTPQKLIFFGIIAAAVIGLILIFSFSSGPSMVPVFSQPIRDENARDQIAQRLESDNIKTQVTADGRILVMDDKNARKARGILIRENLVPDGTTPWDFLNVEKWTTTDFERNVNLRLAIQRQLEEHITALGEVDSAQVVVQIPEKTLFAEDQDPVTASVQLSFQAGSDMAENRKKITGIERLIQLAVPGLKKENIGIFDSATSEQLNDWSNLAASDLIDIRQRELKIKRTEEQKFMKAVSLRFGEIYTPDRVRVINAEVSLDMGKKTVQKTEITPIWIQKADPRNPSIEAKYELNVPLSEQKFNEQYSGSGFNPEGPPGQEGQTPPAYKELAGVVGTYNRQDNKTNYEMNKATSTEEGSPSITRVSIAVAIDGVWKKVYKPDGSLERNADGSIKRIYEKLTPAELESARKLVEGALGFDVNRGDLITVENLAFDRTKEFAKEDEEIRRAEQTQQIVLWSLVGLAAILLIFIVFRLVSREIERRRRLREEELARQHQAMREAALRSAEEESSEVEMSVEDRARLELQEHAINIAREHPEDVAQLIRTWLMEE